MRQFEKHPIVEYELNGNTFLTTNFFIHFTLREILKNNANFLQSYPLTADERPDIVAEKVYGDSDLAWLILMVNDIVDPTEEWVKNTTNFQSYLNTKYDNNAKEMYATSYTTNAEGKVADYDATSILNNNKSPFGTVLSKTQSDATDITKYSDISVAYNENLQNENRRIIKIIKKDYLQGVLKEIGVKVKQNGAS